MPVAFERIRCGHRELDVYRKGALRRVTDRERRSDWAERDSVQVLGEGPAGAVYAANGDQRPDRTDVQESGAREPERQRLRATTLAQDRLSVPR